MPAMTEAPTQEDLFAAVKAGDAAVVDRLLRAHPALAAAPPNGPSPLLTAVYHGQDGVVNAFRARNVPLSVFEAAALGEASSLYALLEADPGLLDAVSPDGWTPLHLSAFFGHGGAVEVLLARGPGLETVSGNGMAVTPLQSALANGHESIAATLMEAGADAHAGGSSGWTPLHYGAANNLPATAQRLLARGVSKDARNAAGQTPKDVAVGNGHAEMAGLL